MKHSFKAWLWFYAWDFVPLAAGLASFFMIGGGIIADYWL